MKKKFWMTGMVLLFLTAGFYAGAGNDGASGRKDKTGGKPCRLSRQEKKEGFRILFDGTRMDQWTSPNTEDYKLEEGSIVMRPTRKIGGNLYTVKEYENFVFRFEFMLTPAANSGLGLRHKMVTTPRGYDGMELQILDDTAPVYKDLLPYQFHGSVYTLLPAKTGFLKPLGEWNCQEVTADGDRIRVVLNGEVILDGNLREAADKLQDRKASPAIFYKKGHIAFLGHGDVVKFRNIRIRELPGGE